MSVWSCVYRTSCVLTLLVGSVSTASAEGRGTALTTRLLLGAGYANIRTVNDSVDEAQRGPMVSMQLDVGARLTSLLGLHAVLLYDTSAWMSRVGDWGTANAGAFGMGGGADIRVLSLLTSLALGWQSTQFTTDDPLSPDGAKAAFVLGRLGYILPLSRGLGLGAHLFGKYAWSKYDEAAGVRYDPKAYTIGGLLSFGFDGSRPLIL